VGSRSMSDLLPFDLSDIAIVTPAAKPEAISYTRKVTLRNQALLTRGIHPATHHPLRPEGGNCGTCQHHVINSTYSKDFHKCSLASQSASIASDIRVKWPACTLWVGNSL
jgi:hypothetical protein